MKRRVLLNGCLTVCLTKKNYCKMENVSIIPALRNELKAGKACIKIRVIVNRKVAKTINTGIWIDPKQWDQSSRLVTGAMGKIHNISIANKINELQNQFAKAQFKGACLTKISVKRIAEGNDHGEDFTKWCSAWLLEKYTNPETLRTYKSELTKLQHYRPGVSFGDINYNLLTGYRTYMKTKLENSDNTVWKSLKFLCTMMNDAIKVGGMIDENPFDHFDRGKYVNPDKLGIEPFQCIQIEPFLFREDVPVIVRRVSAYFLLMCYSGLRFEDAMNFDPEVHVIYGQKLSVKTEKKDVMVNMKLWGKLREVIAYIRENRIHLSNKEFNKWLKVVGSLAGIDIPLTAHVGRHTYGALLADADIDIKVAQKLLGHLDERSTRVYYHIRDKKLDQAIDKLDGMMNGI